MSFVSAGPGARCIDTFDPQIVCHVVYRFISSSGFGQVRFLEAGDKFGVRPIVGAELTVRAEPNHDDADEGRVNRRRQRKHP